MSRIIPKFYLLDSATNTIYPTSEYTKKDLLEKKFKLPKYFLQSILDMKTMNCNLYENPTRDYFEDFEYINDSNEFYLENGESDEENEYNTYHY